jgi:VWFA-related protein
MRHFFTTVQSFRWLFSIQTIGGRIELLAGREGMNRPRVFRPQGRAEHAVEAAAMGEWRRLEGLFLGIIFALTLVPSGLVFSQGPRPRRTLTSLATAPRSGNFPAIHVQSTLVVTPVSVVDRSGRFVENLPENDFRVFDNGVRQRITRFGLALEPVTAVVVIEADEHVTALLGEVRPLGSVFWGMLLGRYGDSAVISFADRVHVLQDFSSGPVTLENTLQHLRAEGSKVKLNDALVRGVAMLAHQPRALRRVIIVFSNGFDRGSKTTSEEVVRAATGADVAIYGLRFAPTHASMKQSREAWKSSSASGISLLPFLTLAAGVGRAALEKDLVRQYAVFTGGVAYTHWKKQTLQDQLQKIMLEINSQYVLTYTPTTLRKTGFHRIQVEVSQSHLRVRTRAGYFIGLQSLDLAERPPKP